MEGLMNKIDEQIRWYELNATRKNDDYIKANLRFINDLYEKIENSEERMFMDKIISTFCEIIEVQRNVIEDVLMEADQPGFYAPQSQNSSESYLLSCEDFESDKQLQSAFTIYCLSNGKSSYTVNDYCSRLRNLWKSFYKEYKQGILPEQLEVNQEKINPDTPLLNIFYHADELNCFICMKIAGTENNRNWANTRAAFNKLDEFRLCCER